MQPQAPIVLSIAAVERDTGLSKDTLRVWERRYGFPTPARDDIGERSYALDQVERLRVVKRLLDAGHRAGRVVRLPLEQLRQLAESTVDHPRRRPEPMLSADDRSRLVALVRQHDAQALRAALTLQLSAHGVRAFVIDVVAPLTAAVGEAWMRGELAIFEEHLYSQSLEQVLRQALASVPAPPAPGPCVLLTTLPGEPHGMGLLMAEAILALEGCRCLPLGPQTPVIEIAHAARSVHADAVALGFAGVHTLKQALDGLAELRAALPASTALWAGGRVPGLDRKPLPGVERVLSLADLPGLRAALPPAVS